MRTRKKKRQVSKQVTTRDFFGLHRGRGHRYVILTQPPPTERRMRVWSAGFRGARVDTTKGLLSRPKAMQIFPL